MRVGIDFYIIQLHYPNKARYLFHIFWFYTPSHRCTPKASEESICRTQYIISIVEDLPHKRCLSHLNNWESVVQAMFVVSQRLRTYRTSNVWVIPTIESYSNKRCLRYPNDWKLFEQAMFEASQRLKAIQANDVWAHLSTASPHSYPCIFSIPHSTKRLYTPQLILFSSATKLIFFTKKDTTTYYGSTSFIKRAAA